MALLPHLVFPVGTDREFADRGERGLLAALPAVPCFGRRQWGKMVMIRRFGIKTAMPRNNQPKNGKAHE